MNALKLENTLQEIQRRMAELAPHRSPVLFNQFLIQGYTSLTLNSVNHENFYELLRAKLCLGTLITLYDDYADRPAQRDLGLLETLYQMNFETPPILQLLDLRKQPVVDFAFCLFQEMRAVLRTLPHYEALKDLLAFDLAQFYSANRLAGLITDHPNIRNALENRLYGHHNMGMVMASMMDLLSLPNFHLVELGSIRQVFLLGQRFGRICNVLSTHSREALDGDITGELSRCMTALDLRVVQLRLRKEREIIYRKIGAFKSHISTFSVDAYAHGLNEIRQLHENLEGQI